MFQCFTTNNKLVKQEENTKNNNLGHNTYMSLNNKKNTTNLIKKYIKLINSIYLNNLFNCF